MSLATLKEVLEIAERTNTAIPGFNIDNIEIPEAIMEAAEAENCPVILTIGQGAITPCSPLAWTRNISPSSFCIRRFIFSCRVESMLCQELCAAQSGCALVISLSGCQA